ncbi:MAG: hypothetical protein ACJ74T_20515 [Pyrinomonadaceae bacterium]
MASRFPRFIALCLLGLCLFPAARAQSKKEPEGPKVFCEPSRALALVGEQLTEAKAFDNPVKRIGVMTRAADLLWPRAQAQARAVFAEAFELASSHFRARGDETRQEYARADSKLSGLTVQLPDQRFVVLRAIAKRDTAWARELAARAAEETREEAKKDEVARKEKHRPVGEKLLPFAESLLETDRQTALAVARSSFDDPATMYLPFFLFKLAESDRPAADALYRDALAAYADRDIESLLYLSQYPFALVAAIAPTSSSMGMARPKDFNADPAIQQLYVNTLLGFAERRLAALAEQPPAEAPPYQNTEPELLYTALRVLETLYGAGRPAALERINELEGRAVTLLSAARQRDANNFAQRHLDGREAVPQENAFDLALEKAESMPADRRDMYVSMALMHSSDAAPLEKVEAAAQKIEEVEVRKAVLGVLYFRRGHKAAYAGDFDEARRLAERVEALEARALLLLNIASESLKRSDDKQRAEELLSTVVEAARKAPDTEAKARALLGVAHLYARFDYLRGLAVMGEAVTVVNRLHEPDLARTSLPITIQGRNFSSFAGWPMPTFTLESSFGELGARDFEATLGHAEQLGDKYLRATAVLALSAKCLEEAEKQEQPKKAAPARGPKKH